MRVHHVAFRTNDLPRLVAFYMDLFGLEIVRSSAASTWLDAGGTIVMLERAELHEPDVPKGSMEIVVFAILPEDRARWLVTLDSRGISVEGETRFSIYFRDPDGRRVGVSHHPHEAP